MASRHVPDIFILCRNPRVNLSRRTTGVDVMQGEQVQHGSAVDGVDPAEDKAEAKTVG